MPFACCSSLLSVHHGLSLAAGAAAAGAAEDAAADPDEAAGAAGSLALRVAASAAAVNLPPDAPVDPRGVVAGDLVERLAAGAALDLRLAAPWMVGAKPAPRKTCWEAPWAERAVSPGTGAEAPVNLRA